MKNIISSKNRSLFIQLTILLILSILFVLLFSTTTSPLYKSNPCWHHGDSGIFQEMGLVIVKGGTPYVDVFDHKGPALFFIQALGLLINDYWGIFCLQCISLFATTLIWYKTLRLFIKSEIVSVVCVLLLLVFLFGYYQRGNMCEEWSLPFISLSVFLLVKHLADGSPTSNKEWLIIGLCACTVLFIRANNIAPILGFAIYSLVKDWDSNSHTLMSHVLWGLIGCIIVAAFWSLYFYLCYGKDALLWMIYGTFVFNFEYIQKGMSIGLFHTIWYYVPIVCFVVIFLFAPTHTRKAILIPLIISYGISTLAIGTNKLIHYLIIFIPLFCVSLASLHSVRWYYVVLLIVASLPPIDFGKSGIDILAVRVFRELPNRSSFDDFHRWIISLPDAEKNGVYNYYALPTCYFAEEKIVHQNRCVMKSHFDNSQNIRDIEIIDGLTQREPLWVLVGANLNQVNCAEQDFLLDNYSIKDSIISYDECGYVYCYKKN